MEVKIKLTIQVQILIFVQTLINHIKNKSYELSRVFRIKEKAPQTKRIQYWWKRTEYITIFKKWDGSDETQWEPITNLTKQNFPLDVWQKWASPVWMDIKRVDVLNGKEGTDTGDEKHIAPLQLEVINRLVNLWSNEGEVVFTPFLGIGSEAYVSVKNNRKAIGIELKDSYFDTAVINVRNAEVKKTQLTLF